MALKPDNFLNEKVQTITKNTLIPISLVIMIVGGTSWVTTMYNRIDVVSQLLSETVAEVKEMRKDNQEIRERLIRIEQKVTQ